MQGRSTNWPIWAWIVLFGPVALVFAAIAVALLVSEKAGAAIWIAFAVSVFAFISFHLTVVGTRLSTIGTLVMLLALALGISMIGRNVLILRGDHAGHRLRLASAAGEWLLYIWYGCLMLPIRRPLLV